MTYDDDLRSFISFNAADYAAEITNGEELILQISRTIKTKRSALFSDGVELNVVFAEFNRYVPVVE
ncbi:MAG: hypothetical protein IPP80_01900 [Ignavibacteria bacterium]|nr:hypothetical protein [Ignavibacteria bacterium]